MVISSGQRYKADNGRAVQSNASQSGLKSSQALVPIDLPPSDLRAQGCGVLINGLRYRVLSSQELSQSISVRVEAGGFAEPRDYPGLAHFVEHLVLQNEKPQKGMKRFREYLTGFYGDCNGLTMDTFTLFTAGMDQVHAPGSDGESNPQLEEFVARTAALFQPLDVKTKEAIKELRALEEEFQLVKERDLERMMALLQTALNPEHGAQHFDWGNHASLQQHGDENLMQAAKTFMRMHYTPANMQVTLCGNAPVPTLERYVQNTFGALASATASRPSIPDSLLPADHQPLLLMSGSLCGRCLAGFWFQVPDDTRFKTAKPGWIIDKAIIDKGPGSLYAALKVKGYINNVLVNNEFQDGQHQMKGILLTLTAKGEKNVHDVGNIMFAHLNFINQQLTRDFVEDYYANADANGARLWMYHEEFSADRFVTKIAKKQHRFDQVNTLRGRYRFQPDIAATLGILKSMTPDHLVCTLMTTDQSQETAGIQKHERWFDMPYSESRIGSDQIKNWRNVQQTGFTLPAANPLAQKLTIAEQDETVSTYKRPQLLEQIHNIQLWASPSVLKSSTGLRVSFDLPQSLNREQSVTISFLELGFLTGFLQTGMNAKEAGFEVRSRKGVQGFEVLAEGLGFTENTLRLYDQVFAQVSSISFTEEDFANAKTSLRSRIANRTHSDLITLLAHEASVQLHNDAQSYGQVFQLLDQFSLKDFQQHYLAFLQNLQVTAMVYGNLNDQQAQSVMDSLQQHFLQTSVPAMAMPALKQLQGQSIFHVNKQNQLPCTDLLQGYHHYFQAPQASPLWQAAFDLLGTLLNEAYFHSMRTEQELGYMVMVDWENMKTLPGLAFKVISEEHRVPRIHQATTAFLQQFYQHFMKMTEQEFENIKLAAHCNSGIRGSSVDPVPNQGQNWNHVQMMPLIQHDVEYERKVKVSIKDMQLSQLQSMFRQSFLENPASLLVSYDPESRDWTPEGFTEVK